MIKPVIGLAAAAALLAACGDNTNDTAAEAADTRVDGPMVSASEEPRNPAVANDEAQTAALTPGANSFTEGQARSAIEEQGYTNIGPMTQDEQGLWTATATRDGAQTTVSVDYKGVVSAR